MKDLMSLILDGMFCGIELFLKYYKGSDYKNKKEKTVYNHGFSDGYKLSSEVRKFLEEKKE